MRKYLPVVMILIIGSSLSISLSLLFQKSEHHHVQDSFQEAALEHASMIENAIQHAGQVLETLAAFYHASDFSVKREAFHILATSLLSHHPYVLGLNWAPRVSHSQREFYERTAQKYYPNFKITERNAQGEMVIASAREEYYPAYYNASLKNIRRAYGFDFASESHRREALIRARDTGTMQATSRVKLVVDHLVKHSIIIFYPIYQKGLPIETLEQRRISLQGFLVGVFRIEELVIQTLRPLNEKFEVLIQDESAPREEQMLYQHYEKPLTVESTSPIFKKLAFLIMGHSQKEIYLKKTFKVFGRTWTLLCTPSPSSFMVGDLWMGMSMLWSGLLCTLVMAIYLFKYLKDKLILQAEVYGRQNIEAALRQAYDDLEEYNRNLTQKVAERTRQLADKNVQLQKNISELQRAKEALRESEQHWHTLIEEAQIGLGLFQLDGSIIQVNKSLTHILGYSIEEFFDKELTFLDISPESSLSIEKEKIRQFYLTRQKGIHQRNDFKIFNYDHHQWRFGPYEKALIHKAGYPVLVRISGLMIERYGEPLIWVNMEDISDLKQAEEALRKSQERIRHFFELPLIGMAIFSPKQGWLEVNDKLCDLFGYTREELKKTSWEALVYPEDFSPQWYKLLLEGKQEEYSIDHRYLRKDGTLLYVCFSVRSVHHPDGSLDYLVALFQDITERKKAEAMLREKEEFLRLVIDNIPELIFWKNLDLVYLGCNREMAQANQFHNIEDIVGRTEIKLTKPYFVKEHQYLERQVMETDRAELHKIELIEYPNGSKHWIEMNRIPLHDINGKVVGILGTALDITERKQAIELLKEYNQTLEREVEERMHALTEQRAFLRLVIDNIPQYILWKDSHSIFLGGNQKIAQFFQLAHPNELIGKSDFDFFSFEQAQAFQEQDIRIMSNNQIEHDSVEFVREKGSILALEMNKIPLHDSHGHVVGILMTAEDITTRRQAEIQLQATYNELNQFKTILDVTLDGVFMIDAKNLKLFYINQGAINQTGYTQEEFLQMSITEIIPQEVTNYYDFMMIPLVDHGQPAITFQTMHRRKDASLIPVEIFLQYIKLSQEQTYFIALVRDITERKLAEAKLQQAKEAAESANRAKSAFLANMSHELRTPLNAILGYTQIFKSDKSLNIKQQEGIDVIHRSGEYLLTLINDVLDLSKIEAGRFELCPSDFHLEEFLKSVIDIFKIRAEQKKVVFAYEPTSFLPKGIQADEKRLRQILINLLSNAIKFTHQGGVTLKVSSMETSSQRARVRFQVEDTGIGIAHEDLNKIFLPFQQVGDSNYHIHGTGLGLSITKKLVDLMGGELHVESLLGQGSVFWTELEFPIVSSLSQLNASLHPTVTGFQGPRRKILVIDDKQENLNVVFNLLMPLGFEVTMAYNGQEGLEQALLLLPDLIVLDLMMPVMDGFECARRLKQEPRLKNIIVIASSASVFDYHKQESFTAGCDDFIPKPITKFLLLEKLQRYLALEWIYEFPPIIPIEQDLSSSLVKLSTHQATLLFDLAMTGDIHGLLEQVEFLKQTDEQLIPLANKIAQLVNEIEIEPICELVKPYMS